jgi:hypothetical protein
MIFQNVWNRFTSDWKSFALLGLGPVLVGLGMMLVAGLVFVLTLGPITFSTFSSVYRYGTPSPGDIFALIGSFLLFFVMAMVIGLLCSGLVYAGLVGSVAAYRAGQPASMGLFWAYGGRFYGRMIGLCLVVGLIALPLSLLALPLVVIPAIGLLVVQTLQSILFVNVGFYPAYLIVSQNMPLGEALGTGFRAIGRNFGETALGGLVMMAFMWVMGFSALINIIPLLGQVAWLFGLAVFGPLLTYYFIERFETNVRPTLDGPGQRVA